MYIPNWLEDLVVIGCCCGPWLPIRRISLSKRLWVKRARNLNNLPNMPTQQELLDDKKSDELIKGDGYE